MSPDGGKAASGRLYDSPLRRDQAQLTQRRVVDAARRLLLDRGYTATTVGAVAREAGVSVQTVYSAVGGKSTLVKKVYDVTLAGDDEPVPMTARPELLAIQREPDPLRKLQLYAAFGRALAERAGPLLAVLLAGARAGDADLRAFAKTVDRERLAGASWLVAQLDGALRPGVSVERARDVVWTLNSPDVLDRLVGDRGWSYDEYETWLWQTAADTLLTRT